MTVSGMASKGAGQMTVRVCWSALPRSEQPSTHDGDAGRRVSRHQMHGDCLESTAIKVFVDLDDGLEFVVVKDLANPVDNARHHGPATMAPRQRGVCGVAGGSPVRPSMARSVVGS